MTNARKEALINRANKFAARLGRATYDETDIVQIIKDMVFALETCLDMRTGEHWDNSFDFVRHGNIAAYSDERENFKEIVKALLGMLEEYKAHIMTLPNSIN